MVWVSLGWTVLSRCGWCVFEFWLVVKKGTNYSQNLNCYSHISHNNLTILSFFLFPTPPTLLLSSLTFPLFFHIIPNPSPFLSHFSITYPSLLFSFISVSLPNLVYFFYITESWFCRVTWFPIFFLIFQNTTKSRFHCVLFFLFFRIKIYFHFWWMVFCSKYMDWSTFFS